MDQTQRGADEAYAGKDLGRREFVLTDESLRDYFEGLAVDAAWYRERSPYGRPVAPSMVLGSVEEWMFRGATLKNTFGTLWMRQEWELHGPLFTGERYVASARVVEIYEHRDRAVVAHETAVSTPGGKLVARGRHHQSYLLHQSTGRVALRDPKAKEGVRRFTAPEGEPLEAVSRRVTLEMCGVFFYGRANYHTDLKSANRLGFENVVVGGRMTLGTVGELMDKGFGKGWFEGGKLNVKFTNIVWPGDTITARGVVTDKKQEAGGTGAEVSLWVEKEDGTVALVGTARAMV